MKYSHKKKAYVQASHVPPVNIVDIFKSLGSVSGFVKAERKAGEHRRAAKHT